MREKSVAWLALQAVAIVASILLAFAIDAWWEARQEDEAERAVLESLHSDLVESAANLELVLQAYAGWQAQFERFLSSTSTELEQLPNADVERMVAGLITGMTYQPTSGTLDAMVSDGRLGFIRDARLRDGLARWINALEDISENEADIRSGFSRVSYAMEEHGGPFRVAVPGRPVNLDAFPVPTGETIVKLRQDAEFMGVARSHQYAIAFYVRELEGLREVLNANLGRLGHGAPDDG